MLYRNTNGDGRTYEQLDENTRNQHTYEDVKTGKNELDDELDFDLKIEVKAVGVKNTPLQAHMIFYACTMLPRNSLKISIWLN